MSTPASLHLVVGMEGHHAGAPLTWATAALSDGIAVVNAATGRRCTPARFQELVEEGHATKLPQAIPLRDAPPDGGAIVVRMDDADVHADVLGVHLPPSSVVANGYRWVAFPTREAFDAWVAHRVPALCTRTRTSPRGGDERERALRHAQILSVHNGVVNALLVLEKDSDRRDFAEQLARAMLRTTEQREAFDRTLRQGC